MKRLFKSVLLYTICGIAIIWLNKVSPRGACVPGLGDMVFMLIIPVAGFLFLRSLYRVAMDSKSYIANTLVHATVLFMLYETIAHNWL